MGVLTTIFLVCSLRTNVVFVTIFFSLQLCFYLLTAAFWALARDYTGNADLANKLIIVCLSQLIPSFTEFYSFFPKPSPLNPLNFSRLLTLTFF